jgi:hypothetical protein
MNEVVKKLETALKSIADYTDKRKPKTLCEAEGMLDLVGLIATTTLEETADEITHAQVSA